MPIYEFVCSQCGCRFERLVSMGREKDVVCPSGEAPEVRKAVSAFGIGGGSSRIKSASSGCTSCSSKSCSTCH